MTKMAFHKTSRATLFLDHPKFSIAMRPSFDEAFRSKSPRLTHTISAISRPVILTLSIIAKA